MSASMIHSQLWCLICLALYCTKDSPQIPGNQYSSLIGMYHACQIIWERLFSMCPCSRQCCAEPYRNSDGSPAHPQ